MLNLQQDYSGQEEDDDDDDEEVPQQFRKQNNTTIGLFHVRKYATDR